MRIARRLVAAATVLAVFCVTVACSERRQSLGESFIEIITVDVPEIETSGWGMPITVDPGADLRPLLAITFGDVVEWDGYELTVASRLMAELEALAEDHQSGELVFRLAIDGSEYWGWVGFGVTELVPPTPVLAISDLRPSDSIWFEPWGAVTTEGENLNDAARRAWSSASQ
jgi:hypothetical protein